MASTRRSPILYLVFVSAVLVTAVVHLQFVPDYFPDDPLRATPVLVIGWIAFTVVFYAAGRLFATPGTLPSMRAADIGTALFLVSLLAAGALDAFGFTAQAVPEAYVLPGLGIYAGLALLGWSIGKRTTAINRIAADRDR
ncbi:hypothetical protein [Natrialbaceae archaeon AArc-T1-2]|uniref:hypothetical protein n=1 Tax=Natrialbaceae archaeon AArc-T1-2 TaxID=3053904 RepID=UPI00255B31B0|nr:hypothetical protein [Natrialbaceae archaeon AArc-T1-2]WIV66227.1 hypothetical protein QQ977_11050 [Natrialbaceae archaeon AArc-T1-2]